MPPMISPKVAAHSNAPVKSNGSGRGAGFGRNRPSASDTSASGLAAMNSHGQLATDRMRPPTVGAAAVRAYLTACRHELEFFEQSLRLAPDDVLRLGPTALDMDEYAGGLRIEPPAEVLLGRPSPRR